MSASSSRIEISAPYASEPFEPSTLTFDRRNDKLTQLQKLRECCIEAAGALTIDYEVEQIRDLIRDKALDEDFSVAVRERWQSWSRNANPFRSALASSAAAELRSGDQSGSDSDNPSGDSAAEDPSDPEDDKSSRKRKRKRAFRAEEIKIRNGSTELSMVEGWDTIRQEREARLADLDAALPSAFKYDERQLRTYAHRLKTKYINSLDRPFEAKDVHRLLRPSWEPTTSDATQTPQADPSDLLGGSNASPPRSVFTISFFNTSLDGRREDERARHQDDPSSSGWDINGDSTRDDYVKRICGDGIGGMKRTQTVELLSSHTLSDLQSSLVCWSDEQPERYGWRKRLKRQLGQNGTTRHEGEAVEIEDAEEDENSDVHFSRFTGKRRQTDTALIIEDKLYTKGVRHGDAAHEADYALLFDEWKRLSGNADVKTGWSEKGGDLSIRLDQLGSIRIGQTYWLLHQGDCNHCFIVEQVRALRTSEQLALRTGAATTNVENALSGSAVISFPRITWLSTPTMLLFASDNKDNYGLGHRILHWEGQLLYAGGSKEDGESATGQGGASMPTTWRIAMGRTKRKDEGLVRKKQGKCLACTLRKAQIGILGGERVRLPPTSIDQDDDASDRDHTVIEGIDDQLITVCTSCAALLGLPTRPMTTTGTASEASVELDWERIDKEKDRHAGWTVFPMY